MQCALSKKWLLGAIVALGGTTLAGCQSTRTSVPAAYRPGVSASVMLTPKVLAFEHRPGTVHPTARFEFSRNDASVGVVREGPILATNDWPQRVRRLERPIRFHRWDQN